MHAHFVEVSEAGDFLQRGRQVEPRKLRAGGRAAFDLMEIDRLGEGRERGARLRRGGGLERGAELHFGNPDAGGAIGAQGGDGVFELQRDVAGVEAHTEMAADHGFGIGR